MAKRAIEDVYRDPSIPDDRRLADLISELGDDVTLADLRRAYRGFEKKIAEEAETRRKMEAQYQDVFSNAAARIQELEQGYSDVISRVGQPQGQNQVDPWTAQLDDPLAGPILKAVESKLSKLTELERGMKERDQKFDGLTKFLGSYGEALLMETQRQAFNSLPDRDPEVTFEQAFDEARKSELWNDTYRQKDPNLRIPDVTKGYERIHSPKKMERMLADAERRGREAALRENRNQTFFPPPPSSALGNTAGGTPKSMDEAFRELSNDPSFGGFPFN